jgi:hypothetical protein
MGDVKYFGKAGFVLASAGELTTDRKGLVSGRLMGTVQPNRWADMPRIGSAHPYATFCTMERRNVKFTAGYWQVYCDYVGCEVDESEPVWDFNPGTGNEPIETIDNFMEIAGTASAPVNDAIWRDENGVKTTDNTKGIFDRFKIFKADGSLNPWAGVSEYLAVNNSILTKSWTRKSKPADSGRPLKIDTPPAGHAPAFAENYTWLKFPAAYTERGKVFDCRQQWMLSGPKGWNGMIYDGSPTP